MKVWVLTENGKIWPAYTNYTRKLVIKDAETHMYEDWKYLKQRGFAVQKAVIELLPGKEAPSQDQ